MRLSISQKLMMAFLGLTLVVLIATLGLARWSFERGFLDYVNALELTRLTRISEDIGRIYVENGDQWEGIDKRRLTRHIFTLPQGRPPPPHKRLKRPESNRPPPPIGRPPRREGNDSGRLGPRKGSGPPTVLIDLDGNEIVGRDLWRLNGESIDVPVIVGGQKVGTLRSEPKRKFNSSIETEFSRQQWITSGVIGIASILLAALVSWGLVSLLLSPVRLMIKGINRLSKGDYSQQLSGDRKDEFGQLMGDINHLTQTLEKNQTARRRWIADISHELRTPLSVLTGEVEALKDGIRPFNKQQLISLDQEIQRLRHLTDDLYELSVSDIGGLRYEFSEINLTTSVGEAIKTHQLKSEEKDISLSFEGDSKVIISADKKRINQLLSNLISNSLAYTDAGGRIEFSLQRQQTNAVLSILDTPPGVTKEACDQLFEPLYRLDESRNRRNEGAGLGLAICRNIVEAHRGTIIAKPSEIGGLQIMIKLPLAQQGAT